MFVKIVLINLVEGLEVMWIIQLDIVVYYVFYVIIGFFQDCDEIVDCFMCLFDNIIIDDFVVFYCDLI